MLTIEYLTFVYNNYDICDNLVTWTIFTYRYIIYTDIM